MQANGIFIIAELGEEAGAMIREINQRFDPRLARYKAPHVTLTGSSGAGPIPASVAAGEIRAKLEPITSSTEPMSLRFGPPLRFMQTEIIVLPLDPHGPLRILHDRIAT
ncbi:MAG TPA: 2'-5' RNA ligase family protein, partial [Gemmatimonadaceae bacterium]|nr:2'-5' RNA ligase family protein [Gemmatimonadaceae bacterium]